MKTRRLVSLTIFLSFFAMTTSGLVLWIVPQGKVAYWAGWRLLGLSKEQWAALHTTFMVLFLAGGIWHLANNWKVLTAYLKNRRREMRILTPEFNVALVLCVLVAVGTLRGWPPLQQILDVGAWAKGQWEQTLGSPPWGHAEETSLGGFVRRLAIWEGREPLATDRAVALLTEAGVDVRDTDQTLLAIARENGVNPEDIAAVLREAMPRAAPPEPPAGETAAVYPQPDFGLGRMTLTEYAERYGKDLGEMRRLLAAAGLEIDSEVTLKTAAAALDLSPHDVIDSLNAVAARNPR